ncbi:MAG: hypothetical protein RMI93_05535 [Caldimicrobium sp.]|nr:hypothetical protein [Caldimicrobium sp.]MDW8183047.1 hypothetical protein [Caldimicrobium sp.]
MYFLNFTTQKRSEVTKNQIAVREALGEGDVAKLEVIFKSLFKSISYEWDRKNNFSDYEEYYASGVYSSLRGAGLELVAEDYTSRDRIGLAILYEDKA